MNSKDLPINYRSGLDYAFATAVAFFKLGIGKSKRIYKKLFGSSPFIHGKETLERYVGIMNSFKDEVLVPDNVKTINKIKTSHIDTHFEKLLRNNCTTKTVDLHASALSKLFKTLKRNDLVEHIKDTRITWRQQAVEFSKTQPFSKPANVLSRMKQPYRAGGIIQYLLGARVSDIQKVYNWGKENPDSKEIHIIKSKGGRHRIIDLSDRPESIRIINEQIQILSEYFNGNPDWKTYMKEYTYEVKKAAIKCGEIYCGPHAFRVNYAEERYSSLSGNREHINPIVENQILSIITEELGHSRISMAKYYIPIYRK